MSTTPTVELARELLHKFEHMTTRDGGSLTLVATDEESIRFRYRPGFDPDCDDDACVLPGAELQTMLRETVARRRPDLRVDVEVG